MATLQAPPQPVWSPNPNTFRKLYMVEFMNIANRKYGLNLTTYAGLHKWSVENISDFWGLCWDYFKIPHSGSFQHVIEPNKRMDEIPKFFKGTKLNFAECLLETLPFHGWGKEDSRVALTEVREGRSSERDVTWAELRLRVARMAGAMKEHGVSVGDRISVVAANSVDTLTVFLAVTSLGGIFSSSSTDMGVKGILDRCLQIKPRWIFFDDAAVYNGKIVELREKMAQTAQGMKGIKEFGGIVSIPRFTHAPRDVESLQGVHGLQKWMGNWWSKKDIKIKYERIDSISPFLIAYSSGTTGQPKCIVHSIIGVVLNSLKEGLLHRNYSPSRTTLQYTTTGWIMYLSSVLTLIHGARIVMYDGSPFLPEPSTFLRLVGDQKVTNLGVSPKYFSTIANAGVIPHKVADLSNLKAVTSTGMVLPTALFHWFYSRKGFPSSVQLCNIAGGTDLAGCFGLENPLTPVYPYGTQGPALGMKVEVFDQAVETPPDGPIPKGITVPDGEPGELVATVPFPNMPPFFWPPDSPGARKKYFDAYYARFDNVWAHGDFIERDPSTGTLTFLGRADGVLNPSGVRFGSAEIYNVLESHFPSEIQDSIVVGQRRPGDHDEKVILFLKLQQNTSFTADLVKQVKDAIAKECSKRHVPAYVFPTPDIPTTVNLKKVELPVKSIVSGKKIKPSGTLLNPESLDYYYQFVNVEKIDAGGALKSKL